MQQYEMYAVNLRAERAAADLPYTNSRVDYVNKIRLLMKKLSVHLEFFSSIPPDRHLKQLDTEFYMGGLLRQNNISFSNLSDPDFLKLALLPSDYLCFIDNNVFREMFIPIDGHRMVSLLSAVHNIFKEKYEKYREAARVDGEFFQHDREEADWLYVTEDGRREMFEEAMDYVKNHPDTPIEILMELI